MKTLIFALCAVAFASSSYAQTHPCDVPTASNITVNSSQPVTVGYCHSGKDADGAATVISQVQITSDGSNVFKGPLPGAIGAPSTVSGLAYFESKIAALGKGVHALVITFTNAEGDAVSDPLSFTLRGVPPAVPIAKTVKK